MTNAKAGMVPEVKQPEITTLLNREEFKELFKKESFVAGDYDMIPFYRVDELLGYGIRSAVQEAMGKLSYMTNRHTLLAGGFTEKAFSYAVGIHNICIVTAIADKKIDAEDALLESMCEVYGEDFDLHPRDPKEHERLCKLAESLCR